MYQEDSFFTLSTGASVGLALLSAAMAVGVTAVAWRMMRGRGLGFRLGCAVVLFVGFVWLSPQVYYAYYLLLIDGLPVQWVLRWPDVSVMVQTVTFTGRATLSAHGQGALFWGLVILAIGARDRNR